MRIMDVRKCFININKDEKWSMYSVFSNCYKKGIFCYIFSDILWWIWEIECYDVVICFYKFEGFYLFWVIVLCEKNIIILVFYCRCKRLLKGFVLWRENW